MKTHNMKKLILILTLLPTLTLPALADVKYVGQGENVTETDQTNTAVTGSNALSVIGGTYTGANIALSSTVSNAESAHFRLFFSVVKIFIASRNSPSAACFAYSAG